MIEKISNYYTDCKEHEPIDCSDYGRKKVCCIHCGKVINPPSDELEGN